MAEGSSVSDSEGLEKQLQSLLSRYSGDQLRADSEPFCSDFCKLVEKYASRWRVPLPQLRILEIALCYFSRASTFFTSNCDHVQHTISSLALSVFELLLFFDQKDFCEEPLKKFTSTFQECHSVLSKYQNVHLHQAERSVQGGGPWSSPALQAILSESSLPQNEVDGCISSELPVFFELRVLYLVSLGRVTEAMALAKCCAQHPSAGQHSFFLQVYLSWLYKTSQHDLLRKEVADINGKDAVHIICSLESDETDELLLALSTAFLSQQLQRGDMYSLCDLVRVWTNLHGRLKTSKRVLLEECRKLMLFATNVKSVFPFIRAVLQEVGEDGIQFCVELCANALRLCLPCDVLTKTLIYKTIAGLLPNDLEVCRACALLVFFLECTVESYKMVYLLYMHPDQEYHVDDSPIGNNVRFETLQVLKKDLYFDPEFWNLIALRTNCLKLLSEKVVSAALEEIMEDKWISKYSTKEPALRSRASVCHRRNKVHAAAKKRHHQADKLYQNDSDTESKRLHMGTGKTRLNDNSLRRKGNQGTQAVKKSSPAPLRRSFWQLDRIHGNLALRYDDLRRTTRFSEKNPPKRRIKKPKWLLEDSGALEENVPLKMKKNGLKQKKHLRSCVMKRSRPDPIKNNANLKPSVKTLLKARENSEYQNGLCAKPTPPPQVILELSLPDNELMDTFSEDACSRPRGFPQVLLYRRTVKFPDTSPPGKTGKEVVLRARDASMFIQQLHCYARRQKGKGHGLNTHGSVSTITRSSVQGSPSKDSQGELCEKPVSELRGSTASQTTQTVKDAGSQVSEKVLKDQSPKAGSRKPSLAGELSEKSERTGAEKVTKSPDSLRILQPQTTGKALQSNACLSDPLENCSTEVEEGSTESQTTAAEFTGDPQLHNSASGGEAFEEPAVEMKVTIASQSPVLDKVSKTEVSQTTEAVKNEKKSTYEIHPVSISLNVSETGDGDHVPSDFQEVGLECGEQEVKSVSSQVDTDKNSTANSSSVSIMDVADDLQENSEVNVPCKNDRSPVKHAVHLSKLSETKDCYTSTDGAGVRDISALTVPEFAPKQIDQAQEEDEHQAPGSGASKDSIDGSKPNAGQRKRTTSRCSVSEQDVSVADREGMEERERVQETHSDIPENIELMGTLPEPEESKLDHFCTFCNKDFKGPRVVEHAMFHYRKDECTFCRMMFKDDLLAMMHLSDHIEKLKRIKDPLGGNKPEKSEVSATKDTSTPKSTKGKTTIAPSGFHSKGRVKISVCSESITDVNSSESRTLRSNLKQMSSTPLHENPKSSKDVNGKAAVQRLNGHIGSKPETIRSKKDFIEKEFVRQEGSQRSHDGAVNSTVHEEEHFAMDSSASAQSDKDLNCREDKKKKESLQKKEVEPQEKLFCPVDGCSWFTNLSKNRVTFLYHTLEKHYGEIKPLELAFRVSNSKCSICMRVLWSFEHFKHHVERHRVTPRHPCLHLGCDARFKSGMEMRRHARKHSPLQAVCCLPGCSQLFICLWALNLHEREHYASKSERNTDVQTGDKLCKTPVNKKHHFSEANSEHTAGSDTTKSTHRLREQATNDSSVSTSIASLKNKLKVKNESTESNVLNLSSKDTSAQPAGPSLRLRKVQVTKTSLDAPKVHKVISSSLLKYRIKFRSQLRKKLVKINTKGLRRRGQPLKVNTASCDGNYPKLSSQKTVKVIRVSNRIKVNKEKSQKPRDEVRAAKKTSKDSKAQEGKLDTRNQIRKTSSSRGLNQSVTAEIKTTTTKTFHKFKNHHVPLDSNKSKESKMTKVKVNNKAFKLGQKQRVPSASKIPAKSKTSVLQKETEISAGNKVKTEVEKPDLTQIDSGKSVLCTALNNLNLPPLTEREQEGEEEEESKTSLITKETNTVTSDSSRETKKSKELKKKPDQKLKDKQGRTSTLKKSKSDPKQQGKAKEASVILQGLQRLLKSTFDDKGKRKEASHSTQKESPQSVPADVVSETCTSAAPEEDKMGNSDKSSVADKTEASKASKKRKKNCNDDEAKAAKKKRKDGKKSAKPSAGVQPVAGESCADEDGRNLPETSPSAADVCISSEAIDRQASGDDAQFTPCKETLAEYSKRPYLRLPPTAYLDEKYITMPKRRKEMLPHQPQAGVSPEPVCDKAALQRQRCVNCFATFSNAEELQGHIQLRKCSNLFGFDSDEEGSS